MTNVREIVKHVGPECSIYLFPTYEKEILIDATLVFFDDVFKPVIDN